MNKPTFQIPAHWSINPADKVLIKNARLIDAYLNIDQQGDLLIEGGRITSVGKSVKNYKGNIINAQDWIVCPGLFDMHVHLREPGYEYKETIYTGCMAAMAGGFTGVAPMPNTNPAADDPNVIGFIKNKASDLPIDVHPIGAVTKGRKGQALSEMAEMHQQTGIKAFSDDGSPIAAAEIMRLALEYARALDSVIIEHCEEATMTTKGVADEGKTATMLGLPGWPSVAEVIAVERNIRLAEYTGAKLHIAHVSTADSVEIIRNAKARGVNITAEVTPHHLTLDVSVLESYHTKYKVNPPLRTKRDIEALIKGLADGTIDAIASDHAPHAQDEKEVEFIYAPFGMVGLETTVGVMLTHLVNTDKLPLIRLIDALTNAPRRIMGLENATLTKGSKANLSLLNPNEEWTVNPDELLSKSHNTPYNGWELTGRACGIINRGWLCLREG